MAAQYRQASSVRRREYIYTTAEVSAAARTICAAFLFALAALLVTGAVTLAFAPKADVDFAGLSSDAACLRVSRHADYTIVYVDVGSPMQRVKLLLDLETVASPGGGVALRLLEPAAQEPHHGVRRLESTRARTRSCATTWRSWRPTAAPATSAWCTRRFVFQNDQAAYAEGQPASIAGLDGTFRLPGGQTVLALDHAPVLCARCGPRRPTTRCSSSSDAQDKLRTRMIDLRRLRPRVGVRRPLRRRLRTRAGAPLPDRRRPTRRACGSR